MKYFDPSSHFDQIIYAPLLWRHRPEMRSKINYMWPYRFIHKKNPTRNFSIDRVGNKQNLNHSAAFEASLLPA